GSGIRTGTVGPEVGLGVGRQHGYKRRVEYLLGFGGRTPHPRPLSGLINEQFVFDNWASNIKAKLISGVCSLGSHDHTSGVVCCVVCVGIGGVGREAVEFPAGTVPIIGTRLRGQVDHSSRGAPVLGPEVVRNDVIFLHRIDGNISAHADTKHGHILGAVQQNLGARLPLPVQAVAHATAGKFLAAAGTGGGVIPVADVTGKPNKVVRVAREAG